MSAAVHALPGGDTDAAEIAARLGIDHHAIDVHRFPDGELRVTVGPADATAIVVASLDHPDDRLIALLLVCEALRRGGCRRIVLVAPYLCYMRQDAAFHPGEAISQRAIGRLLAGQFDRIITVDAHLHRTAAIGAVFPGIAAENLSAMPAIADALKGAIDPATIVVGPDAESAPWVRDLATRLGAGHTVATKLRHGDRAVTVTLPAPDQVRDRPALLVDDIVSSGGTLIACAGALRAAGAARIDAVITHALFPSQLVNEFVAAGIASVRSTTSVAHPTNAIPLAHVLADALRNEINSNPEISR